MSVTMACVGRRDCARPRPSPECFSLSCLSLCDLLQSLFKYAAAQGKLVIKSQRHPLFGALSVYERQKAPKAEENPWNFFYWASETLIPSKHYFRTDLGDGVWLKKRVACDVFYHIAQPLSK